MPTIKDGVAKTGPGTSLPISRSPWSGLIRWLGSGCLVVAVMLLAAGPVEGQAPTTTAPAGLDGARKIANGSKMQAVVRAAEEFGHRIAVPAGSDTVVELSLPLVRTAVAQPQIAEVQLVSPRQVVVVGRAVGSTVVMLTGEGGEQLELQVVVEPQELVAIRKAIAELAGEAQVQVKLVRDTIVLNGMVGDVDTIQRIAEIASIYAGEDKVRNQLSLAGAQQVLLRCTVAEVSKTAARKLGVNGWLAGDNVRDMFTINNLDAINPSNIGLSPTNNIIGRGLTPVNGLDFGTITESPAIPVIPTPLGPELSIGFPRVQMQLFIRALRDNSLLRVLAEPNLVAMSGKEASFLAGGEFPVPIPQGLGTTTIEWRQFGVRLKFLPTVIGRQMIRLNVMPEVSERDFSNAVNLQGGTLVPGLTARSANTTIELAGGSTIAIGGLLTENMRGLARSVPGLGDVPVLGTLFRSVEFQNNRSELVILVTPELVSAMHPDQVNRVPGQLMTEPNDWQLFGLGMIEGEPLTDDSKPEDALDTKPPVRYRRYSSPPDQMSLHGPWGPAEAQESVQ